MILFVSTLNKTESDLFFFERLKSHLKGETFLFMGGGITSTMSKACGLDLSWKLKETAGVANANVSEIGLRCLEGVEYEKHGERLGKLSGQDLLADEAQMICQKYSWFCYNKLKRLKPRMLVALNPLIPHTQIPFEVAKKMGIKCMTFERGMLPESFILDEDGFGGFSSISHKSLAELMTTPERESHIAVWEGYVEANQNALIPRKATLSKEVVDGDRGFSIQLPKPKVLVLGMADINTAIYPAEHEERQVNSPLFLDSMHLSQCVNSIFNGDLIYKPHPNQFHLMGSNDDDVRISTKSPISLIAEADAIVVNGTSLDVYACLAGKPVILAGNTYFSNKRICYDVTSVESLKSTIDDALNRVDWAERVSNFKAFMGFLLTKYLIFTSTGWNEHEKLDEKMGIPMEKAWRILDTFQIMGRINLSFCVSACFRKCKRLLRL